ncbi:RNA polymerase sigma factor CnrH [Rubripirellula lacrimiformis]|uniref:RNA polymerase sigma factor CnrH n=1 Tax=Rubripirellula lacrimiformis TaxID=1930273 RepID=A0A517N3G8_9BACT|nr:sigma-70 family RNA polymerase sigma factor [Rubripirellula lacrimiformis]QDT01673.1 RNA polymerase sigma factor CnrH [Rubripirellula lacrimiformis]
MTAPLPPPEHPTLSSQWMMGVKQMQPDSWNRLASTFGPIVYQWCRTSGVSSSDAADVVQDVFASVARGIGNFERQKEQGSFRSWLATITRNRIRDHFRNQAKREAAIGGTDAWQRMEQQAESLESTVCPQSSEAALVHQVVAMVECEFEPKTWQAFLQTTIQQQPASQVAATLVMSVAAVYQAKSRVLRRIRTRLQELPD